MEGRRRGRGKLRCVCGGEERRRGRGKMRCVCVHLLPCPNTRRSHMHMHTLNLGKSYQRIMPFCCIPTHLHTYTLTLHTHTLPLTLHRHTRTLASLLLHHHSYVVTCSSTSNNSRGGSGTRPHTHCTSGQPCFLMFISAKEHTSPTPDTSMVKLRRKSTMSEALFLRKKKRMKGVTSGLTSSSNTYICREYTVDY